MDEFYNAENIEVFRRWVYYTLQQYSACTFEIIDERTYQLTYHDKVCHFVIWPIGIIEEEIISENDFIFYLHYQFHDYTIACDLFYRMMNKLLEDKEEMTKKILICCSGGMTSGYFKEKMNHYLKLNHSHYVVDACSINHLEEIYKDYDVILIAPQIRYMLSEIEKQVDNCLVEAIEPTVFATYNCLSLYKQIEKTLGRRKENE